MFSNIPFSIHRAIQNTARIIPNIERLAQGCGLVQILQAFEYLKHHNTPELIKARFEVQFTGRGNAGGIYLRELEETQKPLETTATVNVVYPNDVDNRLQVEFEKRILLVSDAAWVTVPKFLFQHAGGKKIQSLNMLILLVLIERTFTIFVDPTGLEKGTFHFTEVVGLDSADVEAGPLFRIPVTVIPPIVPQDPTISFKDIKLQPGQIFRKFYHVPEGTLYAEVTITAGQNIDTYRRYVFHAFQLLPRRNFAKTEFSEFLILFAKDSIKYRFNVIRGSTIEFALAQFWSSLGNR